MNEPPPHKLWNIRVTLILIVDDALRTVFKARKKDWEIGKKRKNRDLPDHGIVKIGQKSLGELKRLVVTQILVKDHQQTVVWKTHKIHMYNQGNPRSVVANVPNYDTRQSEFELQLRYYVHFRNNTLEKGIDPLITQVID